MEQREELWPTPRADQDRSRARALIAEGRARKRPRRSRAGATPSRPTSGEPCEPLLPRSASCATTGASSTKRASIADELAPTESRPGPPNMLLEIFDPKAAPRAIGIDLGTTNSLVAHVRDGRRRAARRLRRRGARAVGRALRRARARSWSGATLRPRPREPARHDRQREALHGPRRGRPGDARLGHVRVRARGASEPSRALRRRASDAVTPSRSAPRS